MTSALFIGILSNLLNHIETFLFPFVAMDNAKWFKIDKCVNWNRNMCNVEWDDLIGKIVVMETGHLSIKMQMKLLALIEDTRSDEWIEIGERLENFVCIEIFEKIEKQLARQTSKCGTPTFIVEVRMTK